jgi:hypothetical protein
VHQNIRFFETVLSNFSALRTEAKESELAKSAQASRVQRD